MVVAAYILSTDHLGKDAGILLLHSFGLLLSLCTSHYLTQDSKGESTTFSLNRTLTTAFVTYYAHISYPKSGLCFMRGLETLIQ